MAMARAADEIRNHAALEQNRQALENAITEQESIVLDLRMELLA
jgi:hypothetical protein